MLKYLLAVAAVVLGFAVFVAVQDERATKHHAQEAANANKEVIAESDHAQPHDYVYNPEGDTPRWYGIFRWNTGITTWGILLTLVALVEQTRYTSKAAEAALWNAQAVINAERARLLFTVNKDEEQDIFVVKAVNFGKVPAGQIDISEPQKVVMKLSELVSAPPEYAEGEEFQEWLAPGESWPVAWIFPRHTKNGKVLRRRLEESSPRRQRPYHLRSNYLLRRHYERPAA